MNNKKLALYFIGPVLSALLGLLFLPISTWFYSKEVIGEFSIFQVSVNVAMVFVSLGLYQSYVREYYETENKQQLFNHTFLLPVIFFLVLCGLVFFAKIFFDFSLSSLLFDSTSLLVDFVFIVSVLFLVLNNHNAHVFRMKENAGLYSLNLVAPKLLLLGLMLVFAYFFGNDKIYLLASFLISVAMTFVVVSIFLKSEYTGIIAEPLERHIAVSYLKFSGPLVLGGVAFWCTKAIDRFFIKEFTDLASLAVYSIAVTLSGGITVLSSFFSNIWHPKLYKWNQEGLKTSDLEQVISCLSLILLIVFLIIGILSPLIPVFFPAGYEKLSILVLSACVAPMLYLLSETTMVGITLTKKTKFSLYLSIVTLFACFLLNFFLVPLYGIEGASLANVLTFTIFFVLRTEVSCLIWTPVNRMRAYFTVFVMLGGVVISLFFSEGQYIIYYLLLVLLSLATFKHEFITLKKLVVRRGRLL